MTGAREARRTLICHLYERRIVTALEKKKAMLSRP